MEYISTDISDDIKHGALTESPVRGTTTRYICNPIIDDITAVNPNDPADPIHPKIDYVPPSCLVTGDPSISDLAGWRWQGRTVDAETERDLIRRIQEGDPQCRAGSSRGCGCRSCRAFFDPRPETTSLLPAFHHSIRKIAGSYIPKGSQRRTHKRESESLIFQDLMAVGCLGLYKAALAFDFEMGCRLWTIAQPKIEGLISNEANYQRRKGQGGGSRIDRWIFDHLGSTPEELLEAQGKLRLKRPVFRSLEEAAEALKRANNLEHSEVYLDDGEDGGGDVRETAATEPLEEFRDLYDSYNPEKTEEVESRIGPILALGETRHCERNNKPRERNIIQSPGRVLYPNDKPDWTEPRRASKDIYADRRKPPYDPDRREVAVIRFKNGKTKRVYRQMAAGPCRHIKMKEGKRNDVRPNRNQATRSSTAEIIVFQSRASGVAGLHIGERCDPTGVGEQFAGTRAAG